MKLIFVGGCGRSGTTLVQKILLIHSQITGGPEFDHMPALLNMYNQMRLPGKRQEYFYTQEQLSKYWQEFIVTLLTGNIDQEKYAYLSEKTPSNIFSARQCLDLFPDSKFIYVYRDGRDVVNSLLKVKERAKTGEMVGISLKNLIGWWNDATKRYKELKNDPHFKGRYLAIRYEDLVFHADKTIGAMMNFLELPVEKNQFSPETMSACDANMKLDNVFYTNDMFQQKINTGNVNKWKKELNLFQKIICQLFMARNLREYNYPISNSYLKSYSIYKNLKTWKRTLLLK